MKQLRFIPAALILAAALSGCLHKATRGPASFEADTLRGATAAFTGVEAGNVSLKPGAFDLLADVDDTGAPRNFTSDVVASFTKGDAVALRDGSGMAVRFIVPRIADNDYCVISAEITTPSPVDTGGGPVNSITADFRYDSRNSGRTEYIWFVFSKSAPKVMAPGKWTVTLFSKGAKLTSAGFTVR
jgi:hypothetical protein